MSRIFWGLAVLGLVMGGMGCRVGESHATAGKSGAQGPAPFSPLNCKRCLILTDQAAPAIDIVDVGNGGGIVWSWHPDSSNIPVDKVKWFYTPDDAKPVYQNRYLLINASGGGVALVRISDGKAVFYAHAGKNPHSSELLPDGNIVTASSTDNRLVIFHADTLGDPEGAYQKIIPVPFAHNVVWDGKRKVLWSAGENTLYCFTYNGNRLQPDLILRDSVRLPGTEAHELFPVYGKDSLFLTDPKHAYYVDLPGMRVVPAPFYATANIKSVSSGPPGWPTVVMIPRTSWWSDEVLDINGHIVFRQPGMKIYKARWLLPNRFSYP